MKKLVKYLSLLIVVSVALSFQIAARDTQGMSYGLLFRSFAFPHHERTSLDLTHDINFAPSGIQKIAFGLSFWEGDKFGYIFRSITTGNNKVDLIYLPEDFSIKLVLNEAEIIAEVRIQGQTILRNNWHIIELVFGNGVEIKVDDQSKFIEGNHRISSIVFGLNYQPANMTIEVPPIAIRDLKYFEDGVMLHHWPLNETSGDIARDHVSKKNAKVRNPDWLVNKNFQWEKRAALNGDKVPAIIFDEKKQVICLFNKESYLSYNLQNGTTESITYQNKLELKDNVKYGVYNHLRGEYYVYDLEPNNLAYFDPDSSRWAYNHQPRQTRQERWQHGQLINPIDSNLYILGGYGYFTLKNDLLQYDRQSGKWKQLELQGPKLPPRYHLAIGQGTKETEFYVFGGIGNISGKQELGLNNFYDLYLIDMDDLTIRKIREFPAPDNHFVPVGNLMVSDADSTFLALCYRNYDPDNNALALIRFSMALPSYEVVSDSIPYSAEKMDYADAFLFKNERTSEIIAVTRLAADESRSTTSIYSLFYPPYKVEAGRSKSNIATPYLWLWAAGLTAMFGIIFYILKKATKPAGFPKKGLVQVTDTWRGPSIYLFGGFMVKKESGEEISKAFSPKLRELFLLLLFSGLSDRKGLVTKRLSETLWPDMEPSHAKNTRGVTIQRLRNVLGLLEGISVGFEDNRWKLSIDDKVYCDFLEYHRLKESEFTDHADIQRFLKILSPGALLPNLRADWLDKEKSEITNDIIDELMAITTMESVKQQPELLVSIADTIFGFDDLNDEGLKIKTNALIKLGKYGLAKKTYDEYIARYESLYNEPFPYSLQEIST